MIKNCCPYSRRNLS